MNNEKIDNKLKSSSNFLDMEGGKSKSTPLEIPKAELPEGGGAIKGIDEKFTVNSINGTAAFSIPLPFSKPRGVAPSLNLNYNSGNGNGIFGMGWSMEMGSIKRRTDRELPKYLDEIESDVFLFSSGEDLVPEFQKEPDGTFSRDSNDDYIIKKNNSVDGLFEIKYYKPRVEGIFARIEKWSSKTSPEVKWRVISGDNVTTLLGWSTGSRIANPQDDSKIYEWLPEFTFDCLGNCLQYIYKPEDDKGFDQLAHHNLNRFKSGKITYTNLYLEKILYGNKTPYAGFGSPFPASSDYMFETIFDYGEYSTTSPFDKIKDWDFRIDAFSNYKPGFELRTTRLCQRILTTHHFDELVGGTALVKSLDFTFDTTELQFTFLKSLTQVGYVKKSDGSYSLLKMPESEFDYQKLEWDSEIKTIDNESQVHNPVGLSDKYQFTDLYSEGLSGILSEWAGGWYYKHNLGNGKFEQAKLVSPKPSIQGLGDSFSLQDLDGNGLKQIVNVGADNLGSPPGFFEINDDDVWQNFKSFDNMPNVNFRDANSRLIDINGDGKSDILVTEDNAFAVYESEGKLGFAPVYKTTLSLNEEDGPKVVFKEPSQTIYLADMSGDGLSDIVRIRASEICYWPNLGYGKFGTKVTLDNCPIFDSVENFNPSLIRLADIDGSGTADIIYLGKFNVKIFQNFSGNSLSSTPFIIDPAFEINNSSNVSFVDLLGNGVACIVWSSDLDKDSSVPLKYIDLCTSKKPHLMKGYINNLGKEVNWEYTPSTKFYIDDKLAGKPWVTKLHFPVQCISKTTTVDKISGSRYSTSYTYHHGYFDHIEKEFRGFGMVEQLDTEDFEHFEKGNSSNVVDKSLHQDPILNKNWYHVGAFLGGDKILNQYTKEYWYEVMQNAGFAVSSAELQLPDASIFPSNSITTLEFQHLSGIEWQQAIRACKGMTIRTEVFAKDAPLISPTSDQIKKELTPYSATLQNCTIELLQPKGKNRYAIYTVKESESLVYNYERKIDDSRVSHKLNVKLDEYGNVLESASIVYPRSNIDATIPISIQASQGRTYLSYSENIFTNDIDTADEFRLRLPSQTRTYELKGISKTGDLYKVSDFVNVLTTSTEVSYEMKNVNPASGVKQKRKVEEAVNLYLKNNLSGQLPVGVLESRGISFESYQLAFTPALLTDIFGTKVTDPTMLFGKFCHLNGDTNWWIRTGIKNYLKSGETLVDAKPRFFMPISYTDQWGAVTKVKYFSNYKFLIGEVEDALGNISTNLSFNFRTLSPKRIQDSNDNIKEVIQDELGRVKAVAVFGKGNEADDLSGIEEFTTPTEITQLANFLNASSSTDITNAAKQLLSHATLRYVFDQSIYKTSAGQKPAVVATISREEHFKSNSNSKIQVMFEYSNGTGGMIMKKMQAEPGIAKKVIVAPDDSYTITTLDTSTAIPKQLRWIGNGRTVKNNKGNIVMQYEPYFSVSREFENFKELVETGVTPIQKYDAFARVVKIDFPNGTFKKYKFDSWKQIEFDPNDNTLNSKWYNDRFNHLIDAELIAAKKDPVKEKEAAVLSAKHDNTPNVVHLDSLGRPVLQVQHKRDFATNTDEFYNTIVDVDFEGNVNSVKDQRGNVVMSYKFDMLGNIIYQKASDSGQRWLFQDILGKPLRTWDERNHEFQFEYDILHRPTTKKIIGGDGTTPLNNVYSSITYGEGLANAKANNFNLKSVLNYDTAGKVECKKFDFKGSCVESTRRFRKDYKSVANWTILDDTLLETETFTTTYHYDALTRIVSQTTPDNTIFHPSFNEAGLLESVNITDSNGSKSFVKNINYNEKGQREKITFGNDVTTNYTYDQFTFRLVSLTSKRQNGDPLQDLYYTTDPVGNVTHVEDKNVPVVFFNNSKITGTSSYKYDALYNLHEATGREHIAQTNFGVDDNWDDMPFMKSFVAGDPFAFRNYIEQYDYDEVGNFKSMKHIAVSNNWTRNYQYSATNNRMTSTDVGADNYTYDYHPKHGFISAMPHLQVMEWNFREELSAVARQKVVNGSPETTYYVYDGDGIRCRKIIERAAGVGSTPTKKDERLYLGLLEIYREFDNLDNVTLERQSYHVVDDKSRIAMIEKLTIGEDGSPSRLVRYQLSNQIGSACIETDDSVNAKVISYEEYHPFGTTSYQAIDKNLRAAKKRYRFTGKERDDESGFEYHGARYYLPWLARWVNADPIGLKDNLNVYCYVANNPLRFEDPSGLGAWDRFCGGLKMVGGVLETVAGVGLIGVGVATSEVGVGIAIGAGGVVVTAHGADTVVSGWRTLWNGEQVDSFTSQGLQAAGVSRPNANLADAGISIVGTLGANLATRAPTVIAVVTEEGVTQAPNAVPAVSLAFKPGPLGGVGHNMVGVTTADGVTTWSHLVLDPATRTSGIVTSGEAFVVAAENGPSAAYSIIRVPVTAAQADAALLSSSTQIASTTATGTAGAYNLFTNSCSTYAATVLGEAGVVTPSVTSPLLNYTSAALQSSVVMQPLTAAGVVVTTTYAVTQAPDALISTADACELPVEAQVCVAPPPVYGPPAPPPPAPVSTFSPVVEDSGPLVCEAPPNYVEDYSSQTCSQ